ncbi:hypothetical protein FRC15_012002 [Serendipita sp. 397]|nr:hypothetical protein FRC15_012002 [Serendipita sp. 397]
MLQHAARPPALSPSHLLPHLEVDGHHALARSDTYEKSPVTVKQLLYSTFWTLAVGSPLLYITLVAIPQISIDLKHQFTSVERSQIL